MGRWRSRRLILVVIGCMQGDGCPEDRAESLLLLWCEIAVGPLSLARWEKVGLFPGRVCVLVEVSLALRR